MQEYLIAKQTVEHILGIDWKNEEEKTERTGTASTKSYSLIAATANEKIVQTPSAQFESHGLNPHYSEKQIVASFFMEV